MTAAKTIEVPMMVGTTGYKNYMAFARKDGMALGIKPVAVASGTQLGVPETTWFGARLRSSSAAGVFDEVDSGSSNVVSFKKTAGSPAEAWPHVTWEKASTKRASTTIGVLLSGTPETSASAKMLMAEVGNRKLATKMVDYLESIVGKENFMISRDEAIDWFDQQYAPVMKRIQSSITAHENISSEMKASIGSFNMHAELLNKAYKKTKAEIDEEDVEDEDEGDHD